MIQQLLDTYYDGIANKSGWERPIADDITFTAASGTTSGKQAYVEATKRFLGVVTGAERRETLVDGDTACVWVRYALSSPRGRSGSLDAVEIWNRSGDRLSSMTLYFDTSAFRSFLQS